MAAIKKLADELGRTPTMIEFQQVGGGFRYQMTKTFGTYTNLIKAAGLDTYADRRSGMTVAEAAKIEKKERNLLREYKSLCSRTDKIQGFFRHVINLEEMFARAGNPPVLKLLGMGDVHAKFADEPALNAYLQFAEYYKPDAHWIAGDFVDAEALSHWPEDSLEPRRIVPEMKTARAILQRIVDATPDCHTRLFSTGNHSNWIDQAFTKMPELFEGLADLDIEINLKAMLGLSKFGYELFPLNHLVQIGRAHFTHGIYTGQNHAKKHLDVFKTNIFYGHLHDLQEHNQTSMDGDMVASCVGCLCRLDAKFLKGKPNNWVHAAPVWEFAPDGSFNFYKLRINNGKLYFGGKVFGG